MKRFIENVDFMNSFALKTKEDTKIVIFVFPERTYENRLYFESSANSILKKCVSEIKGLNFDFFPLEKDLFVNFYENSMNELLCERQYNYIKFTAEILHKLQIVFGKFRKVIGIGKNTDDIINELDRIYLESKDDLSLEIGFF